MNKLPFQGIAYGRVGGLAVQFGRTDAIGTRIQTPREEVGVHFIRFRVMNEGLLSLLLTKRRKIRDNKCFWGVKRVCPYLPANTHGR